MWRADAALREHIQGGPPKESAGLHGAAVAGIIAAMMGDGGVDLPQLGRLGLVRVAGKKPKLTFHAADELNAALTGD